MLILISKLSNPITIAKWMPRPGQRLCWAKPLPKGAVSNWQMCLILDITGARKRGDIGFSAIRGGDIVGEHDVMFLGDGERIILRHVASDRSLFAKGALKAALWGQTQKPGEYDMMDVLGL
jgi:dihydrodipicolinate reductase